MITIKTAGTSARTRPALHRTDDTRTTVLARGLRLAGLLLGLTFPGGAYASEVDSFTARQAQLPDVAPILNAETNRLLDEAIDEANRAGGPFTKLGVAFRRQPCASGELYRSIEQHLGGGVVSPLEQLIHDSPAIPQLHPSKDQTIYRDFRFFEAPSLAIAPGRIAAAVRLGPYLVGADKLGHFFAEGFVYFERAYLQNRGIDAALDYGERTERTYFGALLTGVYSYADLAANFNGMRFWVRLLDRYADPLTGDAGHNPYIKCEGNRWVRVKDFDWMSYVDATWDEGINCNVFRNPALTARVTQAITSLEEQHGRKLDCPITHEFFASLRKKYGRYFPLFVNPNGHAAMAASGS